MTEYRPLLASKLICTCGNMVGLLALSGAVVSRRKGRTIRIERGSIICEKCGELIEVDSVALPAVV